MWGRCRSSGVRTPATFWGIHPWERLYCGVSQVSHGKTFLLQFCPTQKPHQIPSLGPLGPLGLSSLWPRLCEKRGTVTAENPHPHHSGKSMVSELAAYSEQGRKVSKLSKRSWEPEKCRSRADTGWRRWEFRNPLSTTFDLKSVLCEFQPLQWFQSQTSSCRFRYMFFSYWTVHTSKWLHTTRARKHKGAPNFTCISFVYTPSPTQAGIADLNLRQALRVTTSATCSSFNVHCSKSHTNWQKLVF